MKARLDTFFVHNPGIKKMEVPVALITASGNGLDPDISPAVIYIQALCIAKVRGVQKEKIQKLVVRMTTEPLFGFFGPEKVNVLKINIELDKLQ